MAIDSSDDQFANCLQKLYSVEIQLVEALPELMTAATSEDLKRALEEHLEVTKNQADRLEEIAEQLDIKIEGQIDKGLTAILDEGKIAVDAAGDSDLKDAEIIGGCLKVEHYEMGSYQGAIDLANKQDMDEIAETLQESLNEEEVAADTLQELANEET